MNRLPMKFVLFVLPWTAAGFASCDSSPASFPGSADSGLTCSFDATYVYGPIGGNGTFADTVTLSPASSFALIRTPIPSDTDPTDRGSCSPVMPPCDSDAINVADIMSDLANPAVQLLLSMTATRSTSLGTAADPDDPVYSFKKDGTAGFLILGSTCLSADTNCTPVPDSILKLMNDLLALNRQQLMDPSCP